MGLNDQRIFFSDDGALSDFSVNVSNFRADVQIMPFVAAEDFLYFASFMPFNHKYFKMGTANALASVVSVDIWDGDTWNSARDIIDQTDSSGASLGQDGIIRWTTDRDEGWARESDSFDVTGLSTMEGAQEIYSMFWVRVKWSADLTGTTSLQFVGNKFSDDTDLFGQYPDLNQSALQAQFVSGKTDWQSESFVAAATIIRDLRKKAVIFSGDQILDYELFQEASVHKTAEVIFHGLGKSYTDLKDSARKEYYDAFDVAFLRLDVNFDARVNAFERTLRTGILTR